MQNAKSKMKNYGAALAAILFFIVYLFLYRGVAVGQQFLIHNQPDEVANYFFTRELALAGRFRYTEPLSELALNQLHPRSLTVVFGELVPIGFPGLFVLYGWLSRPLVALFGPAIFNYVVIIITPLLAIGTAGWLYGITKRIFSKLAHPKLHGSEGGRIALVSSFLLLVSPPWWYYASRPFQHNTLFVFFFLGFLYFYLNWKLEIRNWKFIFLSATFFGLAVFVRPSELVWLTALLIFFLALIRKSLGWREWLALGSGLAVTAILFFSVQMAVYGAPFGSGYVKPLDSGAAGQLLDGPQGLSFWQAIFLPFGFHPRHIWQNFKNYFFVLWPWWSILTIIGLFFVTIPAFRTIVRNAGKREIDKKQLVYVLFFVFVSVYLLIFYGSWLFYDNLAKVPSIASSQVRYFLPAYVLGLPLMAWFLSKLWSGNKWHRAAAVIVSFILVVSSFSAVYLSFDGLLTVKESLVKYAGWQEKIYKIVPPEGVIMTRYADKYLWPGRRVIAGWQRDEQLQAAVNLLKSGWPVYLYDLALTREEEAALNASLAPLGLRLGTPLLRLENLELRQLFASAPVVFDIFLIDDILKK